MPVEERELRTESRLSILETKMDDLKKVVDQARPTMVLMGFIGPILTAVAVYFITHSF